jgi:hypothetical protein
MNKISRNGHLYKVKGIAQYDLDPRFLKPMRCKEEYKVVMVKEKGLK